MGAPASDPKLSEARVVPTTSRAITVLIRSSGRRTGSNEGYGIDFINRTHTIHPQLTHSQVESTLISMRNRFIWSNHPFFSPTDDVTDQEFATGEVHQTTIISDDPPRSPHHDACQPHSEEEHSIEFMFDDDNVSIGFHLLFSSFHSLQKAFFIMDCLRFQIDIIFIGAC